MTSWRGVDSAPVGVPVLIRGFDVSKSCREIDSPVTVGIMSKFGTWETDMLCVTTDHYGSSGCWSPDVKPTEWCPIPD